MSRIIGIDLGTTNTCTAFVSNKIPRVIPTESGFNTMPSVVTLAEDGSILVGQAAKEHMLTSPMRTLHGIKRLLGRQFGSRSIQALRSHFTYEVVPDDKGEAAVKVADATYSCAEIQSHTLRQIKRYAEIHLGEEIPEVVIAVPAYYSDHQRSLVKEAGTLAGWRVKRIVNEPTAAALAYGFNRGFDQKILIYDLGGGTFDISILELTGNVFQVVATGGDMFLGGADFDARVEHWVVSEVKSRHRIDLTEDPAAMQRVRSAAERAKIELSLLANTQIHLQDLLDSRDKAPEGDLVLSRETLNGLTSDLVDRTIRIIDTLLEEQGIDRRDIDEVIPVGGQTRMPLVVETVTSHFGKSPRKGIHPDECVALGAALLGDSLAKIDAVTLLDTLSVPIGIAGAQGTLDVVINKNVRLPVTEIVERSTTADNQTEIELDVYQGEPDTPIRDTEYLGTLKYASLPPARAGEVTARIAFGLDSEGMLTITASNNASEDSQRIQLATVERPIGPQQDVVEEKRSGDVHEPTPDSGFRGLFKGILKR